jgi:hypothetical protein
VTALTASAASFRTAPVLVVAFFAGFRGAFFVALAGAFFAIFFAGFLAVFFAVFRVEFFAAFLVAFFATLAAFFTRVFAAAFTLCFAALVFFFFDRVLATANSLNELELDDWDDIDAYRVASASIENTEKTSGFRSRL